MYILILKKIDVIEHTRMFQFSVLHLIAFIQKFVCVFYVQFCWLPNQYTFVSAYLNIPDFQFE